MKNFIFLALVVFLSGCTNKTNMSSTKQGGADVGGSNILLGKPIESFIVDIRWLPEYKILDEVFFTPMDGVLPALSKEIRKTYLTRTWYQVPVKLKEIPPQDLAVFADADYPQYALHTAKAVWISLVAQENSEDANYASVHMLHEMVMALRVDQNIKNHKKFLSEEDYEDIRALTSHILTSSAPMSPVGLQDFLFQHHFYYKQVEGAKYPLLSDEMVFKTSQQLLEFIKTRKSNELPSIVYNLELGKQEGYCRLEVTDNQIHINVYDLVYKKISYSAVFDLGDFSETIKGYLKFVPTDGSYLNDNVTKSPIKSVSISVDDNTISQIILRRKISMDFESDEHPLVCSGGLN